MARSWDVVVIGCGSAGSRAAATAASHGARVLAVEGGDELGGLCILRGCMPTKTLLETAHRAHDIREAGRFGIRVGAPEIDFAAQMDRVRRLVARFRQAKERSIRSGGYELRRGSPRFTGPHTLELDGERVEAKAFVVATGSRVRPLAAPPGVDVKTSDDMFRLEAPPRAAVVLGGGAVGLEFAVWLARNGTRVTLSVRSPLLHRFDVEFGAELRRALDEEMEVCTPSALAGLERRGDGIRVHLDCDGEARSVDVDLVLNAMGRVPSIGGLGLEAAGVATSDGRVPSSDSLQTNLPHVFVAGDVAGKRPILHEANREGRLAGLNAARVAGVLGGAVEPFDTAVPPCQVVFTDPAFATTGRTLADCEAEGLPCRHAVKRYPEQGRGIVTGARHGMLRLIVHAESGKVLGCQILNQRADDLIHIPATAITVGATVEQMAAVPWYHPTLAEAFLEVCRELAV